MNYNHGGDIYGNKVILDFSVNINPLGMPEGAKKAAIKGVELSTGYPDWDQRELRKALSEDLDVSGEDIVFGNGASDLIYRIMMVLKPKEVLIPEPSFSEYRSAAEKAGAKIEAYILSEEDSFSFTDDTVDAFINRIGNLAAGSAVFLCNPNNPDGGIITKDKLIRICEACEKRSVWLIVDECFLPFCEKEKEISMLRRISDSLSDLNYGLSNIKDTDFGGIKATINEAKYSAEGHMVVLRAFTKIFGMPGLRLGYMVTDNRGLIQAVRETMTPWEVNVPAQMAGIAALKDESFIEETRRTVAQERKYLVSEIQKNGLAEKNYNPDSEANFILFRVSEENTDLKEKLLAKGILIRSCTDFVGLDERYFRICVRTHKENIELINVWKSVSSSLDK